MWNVGNKLAVGRHRARAAGDDLDSRGGRARDSGQRRGAGAIWTPLIPATFDAERVETFGANTPMGRAGQPAEVVPCYVFLASPDGAYMSGQVLYPNGGDLFRRSGHRRRRAQQQLA